MGKPRKNKNKSKKAAAKTKSQKPAAEIKSQKPAEETQSQKLTVDLGPTSQEPGWQPYNLDYYAQQIVWKYRKDKNVLNESHKMRMAVTYGLERFWGEHIRLKREKKQESIRKGQYWKEVWDKLVDIIKDSGMEWYDVNDKNKIEEMKKWYKKNKHEDDPDELENLMDLYKKDVHGDENDIIKYVARQIGDITLPKQRVSVMILMRFCDALVWWTQRYKKLDSKA